MSETPSTPPPARAGISSVEVVEEAAPAPNGAYPRPDSFSGVWPPEVIERFRRRPPSAATRSAARRPSAGACPPSTTSCSCRPASRACRSSGYREKCDTRVVIGEGNCENPLVLERPIMIAGMSFGALSVHAKRALGMAASRCGISTCTGEGGMHP